MSEQMRKEFEEFAKSNGWDISHNGEHYNHIYAYYAWDGWQASRAAIIVDLGKSWNTSHEDSWVYSEEDVKESLEKLGVSYK
jgi:hypothetical protein